MNRLFIVSLGLLLSCHPPSSAPIGDYYGRLEIDGFTYRLYLNLSQSSLTAVSLRGEEIPLDTLYFKNDSLHFSRADFYSEFNGYYDAEEGVISGNWISEDRRVFPLIFVPVQSDTIVGFRPRATKEYTYQLPPLENDDIEVCSLKEQQLRTGPLDSLVHAIIDGKYHYVHSLLVAKNNCLVLEEYFYGFKRKAHFGIQSATKSFVSALTGIALGKGEINSAQASLCEYFPIHQDLICNEQNKSITMDQVLSMTTGLAWDEITYDYGHEKNTAEIAANQPDQFRYLLSQPKSEEKVFAYNSLNHLMMNHVLQKSTGLDNKREMEERLLKPLGINSYDLGAVNNGIIGDIFLRPRDMLKFGLLYLNNGQWQGNQVVPSAWVKESTTTKIQLAPGFGYAYFWWTKEFPWKGKTVDSYFAWGYGGQYIWIVPELHLVVVFNGSNWSTDPAKYYFEIMEKYILPSCESLN
ncbi:serine hydrolase [Chryseolinea sp. H1M3-3]|uniref:serine hydrolase domain-containing protein n=1 Tax=Chryseolinea sp. H1M3-3 TaxID=3034144 RepID=UPI0023EB6158|nr:serine hydrolase [Chryseolinea sp. H1M3-3]